MGKSKVERQNDEIAARKKVAEASKAQAGQEFKKTYIEVMETKEAQKRAVVDSVYTEKGRQERAAVSKEFWEAYKQKAHDVKNIKGYDDWGMTMLSIFALVYDLQVAMMGEDMPWRKWLSTYAGKILDKLGGKLFVSSLKTENLPVVVCDFDAIRIKNDKTGEVDLTAYKPLILGLTLEQFCPKEQPGASETKAAACDRLMLDGFKYWLNTKGYELLPEEKDNNGQITKKTRIVLIDPTIKDNSQKQGITAKEFAELNKAQTGNNSETMSLTDYLADRLGVKVEPEVDNRPRMSM